MDIKLSDGDDSFSQTIDKKDEWNNYFGQKGNDTIKLYQGTVLAGPGNDTIQRILLSDEPWHVIQAAYWDSPAAVVVDLQGGWADDGWGTRDTLINVRDVASGSGNFTGYGDTQDNVFYCGGAINSIDGRDGSDLVYLPGNLNGKPTSLSDFKIQVSIDGKGALITSALSSGFQMTLSNVEKIGVGGTWDVSYALTSFITPNDLAQQGLVAGDTLRWNASKALGTPVEVTYSFVKTAPASGVGASGFQAFTAEQQNAVKAIFASVAQITGLSFKEVTENGNLHGAIRLGASQQTSTKGVTHLPGDNSAGSDTAGDIWMDIDSLTNFAAGSEGYAALLHEIGHALGLRHPSNVDASDHYTQQFMPEYDVTAMTVMSQTASPDGLYPATFSTLDIAALRYLYGSKTIASGNDTYKLSSTQFLAETSLIDDGGIDTLDVSLAKTGAVLDLIPGHLSSAGVTANGLVANHNLSLGADTWIENAIGSDFDDVLLGNDLDNHLTGGKGNDWIDGGEGQDTSWFAGPRNAYLISSGFGKTFVTARNGSSGFDTLVNLETLQFSDQTINLSSSAQAADFTAELDQNSSVSGNLPDPSDVSRDAVVYAIESPAAHGKVSLSSNGAYTYIADVGFSGEDSFSFTVSDKDNPNQQLSNHYRGFINVHGIEQYLSGDDAENQLNGSSNNDIINTLGGNDSITGNAGNDIIDGGAGKDTALYSGKLSAYTVQKSGSHFTVASKINSGNNDGSDLLSNVEILKFADMSVNLQIQSLAAAAPQANVTRLMELYVAFFNRSPDADGLAYWIGEMNGGQSINQIANSFYNAGVQFSNLTGFSKDMSNASFVNLIYKNVLGRTDGGDAAGVNYWSGELASGNATRGSLVSTMLNSAHGFKNDATWGWVANLLDNKITVAKTIAIDWGINYNTPEASISNGMAIAGLVTATDTSAALKLVGISAADVMLE